MKLMKPTLFLTSLILPVLPASALEPDVNQGEVELNLRYQAGKTYVSKMISKNSSKIQMGGQKMNNEQTMTMEFTMKVDAIEDSENVKATVTYDRIAMDMVAMGQKMSFDSADPASLAGNPMAGLAAMAGKSLTMTISPELKFSDIKGMDKLFEGLGPEAELAKGMFSEDQMAQMMGAQMAQMLPGKKIKAGDRWPYKVELPMGPMGNFAVDGKNKMKGVVAEQTARLAVIEFEATMKTKKGAGEIEPGMNMEVKDGKMKGTYHFNLADGYVSKTTSETTMTLEMVMPGAEEQMKIPTVSKVTMTTTMK